MLITFLSGALILLFWAYAGYPLFVRLLGPRLLPRPGDSQRPLGKSWLLISAYNEQAVLARKLENSLELERDGDLEVVVVSDGSTDRTDAIVEEFAARNAHVRLLRVEGRLGKNHALNVALARIEPAEDDVIVFSDANAIYRADALRRLRDELARGAACVVGKVCFVDESTGTARAEGLYWRYENAIKAAESRAGRLLVANGAIFAARAVDVPRLPLGIGNDFWVPVMLLGSGKVLRYEPRAVALEAAPQHGSEEFQRKLRMANRSMRGVLCAWPEIDAATRFQLVSHKVLRWLGLPIYAAAATLTLVLALTSPGNVSGTLTVLVMLPLLVAALGGIGRIFGKRFPGADLGVHFLLVHVAALLGVIEAVVGKRRLTWEQARSARRLAA
jgi:poly-beta-1,6-N-acetyl-D-glucosamine synthase